jgi:hypothetical protein
MPEINQILSVEGQLVGMPLAGPETFTAAQVEYLKRAMGIDETVLWEGSSAMSSNPTITLSEAAENFKYIEIWSLPHSSNAFATAVRYDMAVASLPSGNSGSSFTVAAHASGTGVRFNNAQIAISGTSVTFTEQKQFSLSGTSVTNANSANTITKIVGIHRISGGNE